MNRWAGPLIVGAIAFTVVLILFMNLQTGPPRRPAPVAPPAAVPVVAAPPPAGKPKNFREYPIGDAVERNALRVAAVWLPAVRMNGMDAGPGAADVIHLEADVKATEGNPNGFALGEFLPYLEITYQIAPAAGGPPLQSGRLTPMVAADGLHYGASVSLPEAGRLVLTYRIEPPSKGGLGRHSDPATGVAPWWEPFTATFQWDYPGPAAKDSGG